MADWKLRARTVVQAWNQLPTDIRNTAT